MSIRQVGIGAPVRITYKSEIQLPNVATVIKDGVITSLFVATSIITGTAFYQAQFSPVETGLYDLIVDDLLVGSVEVVSRDVFSILRNIEDQALGSWEWNKTTKIAVSPANPGNC